MNPIHQAAWDKLGEKVGVKRIMDAFPGSTVDEVEVNVEPAGKAPDPLTRAAERGMAKRLVRECTACELVSGDRFGPSPFWEGDNGRGKPGAETRAVIYTDTPIRYGGKHSSLLLAMVNRAGIKPTFLSSVCCTPQRVRLPSPADQLACRPNFIRQLSVCDSEWLFVVGATALRTIRSDRTLAEIYGTVFGLTAGGRTFKASVIPHVDTLLADSQSRAMAQRWLDDGLWRSNPTITDTINGDEGVELLMTSSKDKGVRKKRRNKWTPSKDQEGFGI